ncbi:MAG TPA: phosphogluconate dehydratase [Solirubrobacterales bacterium]|nr:phosphogluconate dehydratase [Solirubrobacterales bacterium]
MGTGYEAHPAVVAVTEQIAARSAHSRRSYLRALDRGRRAAPAREALGCSNLAHGLAACGAAERSRLTGERGPSIGIVTAYNDMLSAHQPYASYPTALRRAVLGAGGVAQVAGGVPAMCDGITQGNAGMELSLLSREVIAMATAIALAHETFDGALLLGVCDKIVPGLLIGALSFGHLPALLVPAGPMPSGMANAEKSRVRQLHAEGRVSRAELLAAESASYHAPGTCTFYGTANSNQLLAEAMGLLLPGSAFVNPGTDLRSALNAAAGARVVQLTALGHSYAPLGWIVCERSLVNAIVALLASGGSTNHTMHLVAIAAAAGIELRWEDFAALSREVPLLARIYPNGAADINEFHAAGGTAFLFSELLSAGLMHADVTTVAGVGLDAYTTRPALDGAGALVNEPAAIRSGGREVLRGMAEPFASEGGLRLLTGDLGRAIVKTSALSPEQLVLSAPARVFDDQAQLLAAFERDELVGDLVAVVRYQGPRSNGMPELHKLTTVLGVLIDRGQQVALLSDGRMSGASGKVPAAIHCTPEAAVGGPLAHLRDGDQVQIDCIRGTLQTVGVDFAARSAEDASRPPAPASGSGRELFAKMRRELGPADAGASIFALSGGIGEGGA